MVILYQLLSVVQIFGMVRFDMHLDEQIRYGDVRVKVVFHLSFAELVFL